MTNAAIKRQERQARDISFKLERYLKDFKNTYLGDFVNFRSTELQDKFNKYNKLATCPKTLKEYNDHMESMTYRRYTPANHSQFEFKASELKKQLDLPNLSLIEWLNEADKNYKSKFNTLVSRLVEFDVSAYRMKLIFVDDDNNKEFSFMITDHLDRVVHARVIYACGMIKAPHYRFIVTERKQK